MSFLNDNYIWVIIFSGLLGLGIGSFLNVVIERLHDSQSIRGRSRCPHCQHVLPWYCLIPVVSYVLLRARCFFCKRSISLQYPLVEIITAALFVTTAVWSHPIQLLWHFIMISFLILIFIYDLKYYLIPDVFSIPAIIIAIVGNIIFDTPLWNIGLAVVIGSGIFLLQYLISRGRWIGGGDIRLGALLGAYLAWPLIIVALFFAYVFGALAALSLIAAGQKQFGDKMPFGTALVAATIFTLWFGEDIMLWYIYDLLH